MTPAVDGASTQPEAGGPSNEADRLDSWKAIAAYLERDLATVRRWEKSLRLPVHRVAGAGRSVFAYKSEIDVWLRSDRREETVAPVAMPAAPSQEKRRWAWRLAIASAAVLSLTLAWRLGAETTTHVDVSTFAIVGRDSTGRERWRYPFPAGVQVVLPDLNPPSLVVDGIDPAVYVATTYSVNLANQEPHGGQFLELSRDGALRRSFSLEDVITFSQRVLGPPWAIVAFAVRGDGRERRIAVAAHHYTWDPAIVTILDDRWQRQGTFVHAGWIEQLRWRTDGQLLVGGYSESRAGGLIGLLDPSKLDGQGPEDRGGKYFCESCGAGQPRKLVVMPRSEVNRVDGARFNRAFIDVQPSGIAAKTIEIPDDVAALYQFTAALDVTGAAFGDRYWDAHRRLEIEGRIDHSREHCPDRNGPREVLEWTPDRGWHSVTVPHN